MEYIRAEEQYALCKEAVKHYGKQNQVDMAIEEMSELIKALLKERRASKEFEPSDYERKQDDISEEMADVYIMLDQLMVIFQNSEDIVYFKSLRLKRLRKRIDGD